MSQIDIFLLFPQTEEEILRLGDNLDLYKDIPKQLALIKQLVRTGEYKLFYDSENITAFCKQAAILCGGKYLDNIRRQLLYLLGKKALDVAHTKNPNPSHDYYQWFSDTTSVIIKTDSLHRCAAENKLTGNDSAIISFSYEDPWNRDIIPLIQESRYNNTLPQICNIPYFNPVGTFIEWYKSKILDNRSFSLTDITRFERTNKFYEKSKRRIYKERSTNRYWYYDFFHSDNKEHYEVFDNIGNHVGEADMNGVLDETKKDKTKSIRGII